jgi:hypothetical protein
VTPRARAARRRATRRGGGILLEVLVSLALFVGAATFTLGATRHAIDGIERMRRRAEAVDLARAKLAELEAGLVSLADLRDAADGVDRVGSLDSREDPVWLVDVTTGRTEFTGLTLVELTIVEVDDPDAPAADQVSVTLRQLMALRDGAAGAFEEDEMLRDLPVERGASGRDG